ncbi:hypothetical protein PAMP_010069 [Pampus punctatissimus]
MVGYKKGLLCPGLPWPALSSALLRATQWLQWNVMTMDRTKPCIHPPSSHSRSSRLGALITETGGGQSPSTPRLSYDCNPYRQLGSQSEGELSDAAWRPTELFCFEDKAQIAANVLELISGKHSRGVACLHRDASRGSRKNSVHLENQKHTEGS